MKRLFRTFCYYVGVLIEILFTAVYMPPWVQSTFGFKIAMIYCFMFIITTFLIIPVIIDKWFSITNPRRRSERFRISFTLGYGTAYGLRGLPATDVMLIVLVVFFYEIAVYVFHQGVLGDGNPD